MFKSGNYALIEFNELNANEDWYYYLWLFLFMPAVCTLIFSAPVYLSFKSKNPNIQWLVLAIVIVTEYFIYTYLASPSNFWNGVYNAIVGILVFMLLFNKHLQSYIGK
jgi:hypothetical protein